MSSTPPHRSVAPTAAAAAAAAAWGFTLPAHESNDISTEPACRVLVLHLRQQADEAEAKAKRLYAQAKSLAEEFQISEEQQKEFELNPSEMAPMDEHGIPKYRGKKRGRKPKPRLRKHDPNRRKRQHTGYTYYMHTQYPLVKAQNPTFPSKEVIRLVAQQWKELPDADREQWKEKASETHETDPTALPSAGKATTEEEEEGVEEMGEDPLQAAFEVPHEDDEEPAPPARRPKRRRM